MPGTANGDPKSELQAEGSLAGFETIEALLEVCVVCFAVRPVSDAVVLRSGSKVVNVRAHLQFAV